jgi:transcriptional regulator with XRE-family HTH domain
MKVNPYRIVAARLGAGLSRDELAIRARTSARNIARWEKEGIQPRGEHITAIAEATGQEVGYFFSEDESEDGDADLDAQLLAAFKRWRSGSKVSA